jgi:hypothetical protein
MNRDRAARKAETHQLRSMALNPILNILRRSPGGRGSIFQSGFAEKPDEHDKGIREEGTAVLHPKVE